MELNECKKQIKELVFGMANAVGVEHTEQFLVMILAILRKHEAEEQ